MNTYVPRLCIPDYDPFNPEPYPGDIKPGYYSESEVNDLLEKNKDTRADFNYNNREGIGFART